MRIKLLRFTFLLFQALCLSTFIAKGQDTIQYSFSFNYYKDLSDTFSGGTLLSGEFTLSKSWYGVGISFGHFQSRSTTTYQIVIEGDNQVYDVPFDEMAILQTGSLLGLITPIQKSWLQFDILFGLVLSKSENLCFKSISYTYDLNEKILTSVEKDYQLVERTHFGYQTGVNVTFYVSKKIGLQLKTRIQDLSNGGTFFFVGTGLCLRL
jgi:hypothetical protein